MKPIKPSSMFPKSNFNISRGKPSLKFSFLEMPLALVIYYSRLKFLGIHFPYNNRHPTKISKTCLKHTRLLETAPSMR